MSNILNYRAPYLISDQDSEIALYYRSIKKICRKCHAKLPINADKCIKCHSKDLRLKHKLREYNGGDTGYGYNKKRNINLKEIRKNYKFQYITFLIDYHNYSMKCINC